MKQPLEYQLPSNSFKVWAKVSLTSVNFGCDGFLSHLPLRRPHEIEWMWDFASHGIRRADISDSGWCYTPLDRSDKQLDGPPGLVVEELVATTAREAFAKIHPVHT